MAVRRNRIALSALGPVTLVLLYALEKYADNETVFSRLLGNAIYIGQAKDTYQDFNGAPLAPEARKVVMEKAREIVLRDKP